MPIPSPNTIVKLLSNVPLDNTYNHTMTFVNTATQAAYFSSKAIRTYDNFSYQRYSPENGALALIRIPEVADHLYTVNYIMFQNVNYSQKWFYGFVLEVRYVNDGMCEIIYQLDVMQTWLFDYTIKPSFVAREHVNNDTIGANLIDENLETGEFLIQDSGCVEELYQNYNVVEDSNYVYMCCVSEKAEDIGITPAISGPITGSIGGLLSCVYFYYWPAPRPMKTFLAEYNQKGYGSTILNVFPWPVALLPTEDTSNLDTWVNTQITSDDCPTRPTNINGYTPKNNKLFTYPYTFILCNNGDGNGATFRYEFFDSSAPIRFSITGTLSGSPNLILAPMRYKGEITNWNEAMGMNSFPISPIITDTYRAYLAQNASYNKVIQEKLETEVAYSQIMPFLSGAGAIGGSAASMSPVSAAIGAANLPGMIANTARDITNARLNLDAFVAQQKGREKMPPQAVTNWGNETAFGARIKNFWFYQMCITSEYARIIDDYFSMYGYKVNRIKTPNVFGRLNWNYVELKNAQVIGNVPANDLNTIIKILEAGITFWHTTDVGNYNLPNGITG